MLYKTIGKRYKECLRTMVFLLEFLLEEKKDARQKSGKSMDWKIEWKRKWRGEMDRILLKPSP